MIFNLDEVLRKRHELYVGAFLGMGFISVVFVVLWTLWQHGTFDQTYTLHCIFKADIAQTLAGDSTESPVIGINQGTRVLINGAEVGRVDSVVLQPSGDIRLRLTIKSNFSDHIRTNSVATPLRERNLMSDRVINISHSNNGRILHNGDTLHAEPARDIENFITQARLLLQQVESLVKLGDTLVRMAQSPKSSVGALLASNDVYVKLNRNLDALEKLSGKSDMTLTKINEQAPQLLSEARQLSASLQELSHKGSRTIEHADRLIQGGDTLLRAGTPLLLHLDTAVLHGNQTLGHIDTTLGKTNHVMDSLSVPWLMFRSKK